MFFVLFFQYFHAEVNISIKTVIKKSDRYNKIMRIDICARIKVDIYNVKGTIFVTFFVTYLTAI